LTLTIWRQIFSWSTKAEDFVTIVDYEDFGVRGTHDGEKTVWCMFYQHLRSSALEMVIGLGELNAVGSYFDTFVSDQLYTSKKALPIIKDWILHKGATVLVTDDVKKARELLVIE